MAGLQLIKENRRLRELNAKLTEACRVSLESFDHLAKINRLEYPKTVALLKEALGVSKT